MKSSLRVIIIYFDSVFSLRVFSAFQNIMNTDREPAMNPTTTTVSRACFIPIRTETLVFLHHHFSILTVNCLIWLKCCAAPLLTQGKWADYLICPFMKMMWQLGG